MNRIRNYLTSPSAFSALDSEAMRQQLRCADIIVGVDTFTQREFVVFGQSALQQAIFSPKFSESVRVVRIELNEENGELDSLCEVVEMVRGRHEFSG